MRICTLAPALLCVRPRAFCVASAAAKRVVFLGTPSVAARSLELLLQASREEGSFEIAAVVSQPPARAGRKMKLTPSPVQQLAESEGLMVLTPPTAKDEEFITVLSDMQPDLCITAAYGCFLPQRFLDLPAHGTLNIHPSLLPLYRGAAPVQRCLEAGDLVTGVTVAFTVLEMDSGPVLRQVERPLNGDEQGPELLAELFEAGTANLLEALPSVWDGSCQHVVRAQDGDRATSASKVRATEAEVRLDTLSAAEIHNRARGFAGWPGIWTEIRLDESKPPVRAKLLRTALGTASDELGEGRDVSVAPGGAALLLRCADGSVLEVSEIQLPGKKPVNPKAFWNGLNGRTATWVGRDESMA